jgi:hypothetical protein
MTHETLKVDHDRLGDAQARLDSHAANIPKVSPGFTVSGSDALSTAIATQIPKVEEPVT